MSGLSWKEGGAIAEGLGEEENAQFRAAEMFSF